MPLVKFRPPSRRRALNATCPASLRVGPPFDPVNPWKVTPGPAGAGSPVAATTVVVWAAAGGGAAAANPSAAAAARARRDLVRSALEFIAHRVVITLVLSCRSRLRH